MVIHRDIIQGTDEWHEIRKLKLTASNATAIGANGAGLKTYINKLILAVINPDQDRFYGKDMERGHELEPIARTKYEFEMGVDVEEVGFISQCEHSGFSPDGLVNVDYKDEGEGLVEIKARNDEKHFALLKGGNVESGVRNQMQFALMVSKRKWCDFVSYNPNFKQSLFVKRFYVDEKHQLKLKEGLEAGINMLKDELESEVVQVELKKVA